MSNEEVLKAVFPLLDGVDLASCMVVCKQWRDIAKDDYLWKCACAKRWPSICQRLNPLTLTYHKLYKTFYKRKNQQSLLPPRLTLDVLEFFIDIWSDDKLIFSEVVPSPVLGGIKIPPPELVMSLNITSKDINNVACIISKSLFDYIDRTSFRALAFDFLNFSPQHPFIPSI
ncbi:hypothetical protein K2173_026053 [Erythroxylum novogranatense]|uniref:F-box domain-containing protein n=1 Tax=Erythroxylum novogranatense TaxID=1862640 RepID=A0AAV8TVZ5_9ROSI|nr:hypothetical protein K2173_026053 [Erythroxylum novogranatense]